MQTATTSKRIKFIINVFYFTIIIVLAYLFLKYVFVWLLPFILGLIITLSVEPVTRFLCEKFRFKRGFASTVTTLGFWAVLGFLFYRLFLVIFDELKALTVALPSLFAKIPDFINELLSKYKIFIDGMPDGIKNNSDSIISALQNSLDPISKSATTFLVDLVTSLATELPNILVFLAVSMVASTFISADLPRIKKFIMAQIPLSRRPAIRNIKSFIFVSILKFFRAQIIILFITFCELSIGFTFLKVQYSIVLAAIISLVDILPIIGTNTVVIPWGIIEILSGNTAKGFWLIALSITISVIRQIIEPRIVGHHLGLYPLVTLISIYVGLQLFGVVGIFILPMLVMLFKHMQEEGLLKIWNDPKKEPLQKEPPKNKQSENMGED